MEKRNKPCGLLVQIEKDALGRRHNQADYMIGYFDRLSIQPIQTWLQFMPSAITPNYSKVEAQPVSVYPIKLLFPSQEITSTLLGLGLDYESWASGEYAFFDQYPCITVALINLTDLFKGSFPKASLDEQLMRFAKIAVQADYYRDGKKNQFSSDDLKDAHFCILPSLGYSDYCLLFAEKGWNLAPSMLDYLHRAFDAENPVLSTDYTMPVYHAGQREKVDEPNPLTEHRDNQMSMSVQVSLRPGASVEKLKADLASIAEVYHITGSGDCVIIPHGTEQFGEVLRLLMPNHKCGMDTLKNIAMDTETLLRWPAWVPREDESHQIDTTCNSRDEKKPGRVREEINKLRHVLSEYETMLCTANLQMRNVRSMYEHLASLDNICSADHNASLQSIMAQWLPAYSVCLAKCVEELKSSEENTHNVKVWDIVENSIAVFNEQAGSFMADLSRSDNFFMESERYNHTSVSSATSLIIAYNQWQNQFAESVMKHAGIGEAKYVFLVKSGGCDRTDTIKPFWALQAEERDGYIYEQVPFITQMSEIGLFDCSGTIFRMTHECMHFCGDRKRGQRLNYMIQFVARYYGRIIACLVYRDGAAKRIIRYLSESHGISDEKLFDEIRHADNVCARELEEDISDYIVKKLTGISEEFDEISLMSVKVNEWLLEELSKIFIGYTINCSGKITPCTFVRHLVKKQLETLVKFYDLCDKIIHGWPNLQHIRACRIESEERAWKVAKLRAGYKTENIDPYLTRWTALLVMNLRVQIPAYNPQSIFQAINQVSIENIVPDIIITCFTETYADLEACMRLDASISDYLLGFFFECQDVEMVLHKTDDLALRVVSVLKVQYGHFLQNGRLSQQAEDELKRRLNSWKAHGFSVNDELLAAIVGRINFYIQEYEEFGETVKPLEIYLEICKADYMNNYEDQREMQQYQTAFRNIRLVEDRTDADAVGKMITALMGIGGGTRGDA